MNMSYCRFQNTSKDLLDCVIALEDESDISEREMYSAKQMRELCERYIDAFDEYVENTENEI